jgi:hypothetical protein
VTGVSFGIIKQRQVKLMDNHGEYQHNLLVHKSTSPTFFNLLHLRVNIIFLLISELGILKEVVNSAVKKKCQNCEILKIQTGLVLI